MDRAQTTRPDVTAASLARLLRDGSWRWRRAMAAAHAMQCLAGLVVIWLGVILLDAWRTLPVLAMAATVVLLVMLATAGVGVVLWRLLREPDSTLTAARWDDHRDDAAHRLLIAWQLASGQCVGSASLADAAMARAMADVNVQAAPVPRQQLRAAGIALMASLAGAVLVGVLMPGPMLATSWRLISPLLDLPTFTAASFTVTATPDRPIASQPWTVDAVVEHPTRPVDRAWLELDDAGQRARISMLSLTDEQGRAAFRAMLAVPPNAQRYRIDTPVGRSAWSPMPAVTTASPNASAVDIAAASSPSSMADAAALLDAALTGVDAAITDAQAEQLSASRLQGVLANAHLAAAAAMNAMPSDASLDDATAQQMASAMSSLQSATSQGIASPAASLATARDALRQMREALRQAAAQHSSDRGAGDGMGQGRRPSASGDSGGSVTPRSDDAPALSEGQMDGSSELTTHDAATADVDLLAVPPMYRDAAARYFRAIEND